MQPDRLDTLFHALADPTRRAILARLSAGPETAGRLSDPFDMALPSFMAHLKRLEDGGLIETKKTGRTRVCALKPGALGPAKSWIEEQRDLWEARLDGLEATLNRLMTEDPE